MDKELVYEHIQKALLLCTKEDSKHSAIVILVNEETEAVNIYGMNIDQMEVPVLLEEAADRLYSEVAEEFKGRTLQ